MNDDQVIAGFLKRVEEWRATGRTPADAAAAVAQLTGMVEQNRLLKPQAIAALTRVDWYPALAFLRALAPPDMVFIPAGEFTMGSPEREDEQPVHTVWLDSYYLDKTPVTNKQFAYFWEDVSYTEPSDAWEGLEEARRRIHMTELRRAPFHWFDDEFNAPARPVVGVSWHEAMAYARWAGKRLPSEAEWEKAARGTDQRRYPWGDQWDPARSNTNLADDPANRTTSVGTFSPLGDSPYGVQDMAGNVWEWTNSLYRPYPFDVADGRELQEESGARVLRGGAYRSNFEDHYRSAYRYHQTPSYTYFAVGFRCAATVPPGMRL